MTKAEKLAEEYESNQEGRYIDDFGDKIYASVDIGEAFLAGYEAGKPKWHKVADGDLPLYYVNVLTDKGFIAFYNGTSYTWETFSSKYDTYEIEPPIAWCELPKFEEE